MTSGGPQPAVRRPCANTLALAAALVLALPAGAPAQSDRMVLNATSDYRDMAVAHDQERRGSRKAPPRGGRFVYGHWTPYQAPSPESYGADATTHVIARGDSLWGIASQHYGDGLLWPYLWESNGWILDPDWIYPGDVLLVPPLMTLPDGTLSVSATGPMEGIRAAYIPAGFRKDYNCGHFIADPNREFFGEIVGAEADPEPVMHSLLDVVYVNVGSKDGVLPGDEFAIVHRRQHFDSSAQARGTWFSKLKHPMTGKTLGYPMHMTGRLKIILLGDEISTARITYACDAIEVGYKIYPFMEIPQPLLDRNNDPWDARVNEYPDKGRGFIAYLADEVVAGHEGLLATIDLGADEGVLPGDVFTIFRDNKRDFWHTGIDYFGDFWDFREGAKRMQESRDETEKGTWGNQRPLYDLPPRAYGQVVVLYTERHTSTVKIIAGKGEIIAGDSIVYDPVGTRMSGRAMIDASSGLMPDVPLSQQSSGMAAPMETFAPLGQ